MRRAFTLVELTVVLLILAIAAAAVTLRVHGPMRRARLDDVIAQVQQYDHLTRQWAREHDRPAQLVVDLSAGRLSRADEAGRATGSKPLELGSDWAITRLRIGREDVSGGQVSVHCSRAGLTPTYAMELTAPGGRRVWLLFAGLTGWAERVDDEAEVQDILAAAAERHDAG